MTPPEENLTGVFAALGRLDELTEPGPLPPHLSYWVTMEASLSGWLPDPQFPYLRCAVPAASTGPLTRSAG